MAIISINIDDTKLNSLIDAIAQVRLYQDTVDGKTNPVSKDELGKNIIANALSAYVEQIYSGWVASASKMNASKDVKGQISTSIK